GVAGKIGGRIAREAGVGESKRNGTRVGGARIRRQKRERTRGDAERAECPPHDDGLFQVPLNLGNPSRPNLCKKEKPAVFLYPQGHIGAKSGACLSCPLTISQPNLSTLARLRGRLKDRRPAASLTRP